MNRFTAEFILEKLNQKCEIDYCMLNEAEVVDIIVKAYEENEKFLENNK